MDMKAKRDESSTTDSTFTGSETGQAERTEEAIAGRIIRERQSFRVG